MSWTERQRAMLREMGLRLWTAEPDPAAPAQNQAGSATVIAATAPAASARPIAAARAAPPPVASPVQPPATLAAASVLDRPPTDPARLASIAQMDWPALRQAVAGCTACGLCQSRTQTVFGAGHERAHWMVVGEAPGEQEDKTGEPFVGRAGQLLDRMLAALQISRTALKEPSEPGEVDAARQVYIANTLKCRPPRNRNPAPEEMQRCEPFLLRQIDLLQPRIILAMGAFAVKALLRSDEPVGRLRGQVHRYHGVPLVVTYHPSYLLRQPAEKAKAWDDLCLAMDTVQRLPRRA